MLITQNKIQTSNNNMDNSDYIRDECMLISLGFLLKEREGIVIDIPQVTGLFIKYIVYRNEGNIYVDKYNGLEVSGTRMSICREFLELEEIKFIKKDNRE